MPSSKRAPLRVRTVGLIASIVSMAGISLTLLADNGSVGFGGSVTRSRFFLLCVAVAIFFVHYCCDSRIGCGARAVTVISPGYQVWSTHAFGNHARGCATNRG